MDVIGSLNRIEVWLGIIAATNVAVACLIACRPRLTRDVRSIQERASWIERHLENIENQLQSVGDDGIHSVIKNLRRELKARRRVREEEQAKQEQEAPCSNS